MKSLDEFNGLKSRSHSTVLSDLISGLGGEPQFIAFADVYTALERGVIDAAVSCGSCGYAQRWYEVADYLVGPIVSIGNAWMTININTYNELPKDFQNIILEEGACHAYLNRTLLVDVWTQRALDDNQAEGMEFFQVHRRYDPGPASSGPWTSSSPTGWNGPVARVPKAPNCSMRKCRPSSTP